MISVKVSFRRTCCSRLVDATVAAETLHGLQQALGRLAAGRCGKCQRKLTETQNVLRMTGRRRIFLAKEDSLSPPDLGSHRGQSPFAPTEMHRRWDLLAEHERTLDDWHDTRSQNHTIDRVVFPGDGVDIG